MRNRLDLIGWALFAASGLIFLVAAIRAGEVLLVLGSITWMVGVAFFLADKHLGR